MDKLGRVKKINRWLPVFVAGMVLNSVFPGQVLAAESSTDVSGIENRVQETERSFEPGAAGQTTTAGEETNYSEQKTMASYQAAAVETWMPDANLRKAVAYYLSDKVNTVNPEDITKKSMAKLKNLNFNLYLLNIASGTVVDLTGLEYAGTFESFDSSNIVAENTPAIQMMDGGTATVQPNVLPYLKVNGRLKQLSLGTAYGVGIPAAELTGVAADINRLNPTDVIRVYSADMLDFSSLGITTETETGVFSSLSYNAQTPYQLPPLTILEGQTGEVSYTQDVLKAYDGAPLISNQVSVSNPLYVRFVDENMQSVGDSQWQLTDEGITFAQFPQNVAYIVFNYLAPPIRSVIPKTSYLLSAMIPIVRATLAEDVTVSYLNEKNEVVRPAKTISGNVGDSFDAATVENKFDVIGDYELDTTKLPTNAAGNFSAQAQSVVYHYKKRTAADVTVKYVDEADKEIREAKTISGKIGDSYDAATAEYKLGTIDAYVLDESKLPTNAQGSLDDTAKTIVYHYKKESKPVTSKVSVVYIDEAGKEIQEAKTISGNAGETYDATTAEYKLAAIKEYILDENKLPSNGKGTFAAADQTVTYHYYKKNVVPAAKNVTVKYVDEAGKEIRDAQTIKGQTGEAYDVTTEKYKLVQIEDYQLNEDKLPSNGKGQFSETDQVVTYVYQKTGKLAVTSTKYSIYGTRSVAARGHAAGQKNLPKTGEETFLANILVLLGSVILVSALMVLVRRRKV